MEWVHNYLLYCSIYIFTIVVFYLLGKGILFLVFRWIQYRPESIHEDVFAATCIGAVVSVVIFSIVVTGFRTINLLFLGIGAVLFGTLKAPNSARTNSKSENSGWFEKLTLHGVLSLLFYALVLYTFFACSVIRREDWSSFLNVPTLFDFGLYGADMQMMVRTGQENHTHVHAWIEPDYGGLTLYHFFDIWLGAIWYSFLPNLVPVYAVTLISYSVCAFITLAGCCVLIQSFTPLRGYHPPLVIASFFVTGWFFVNGDLLAKTPFGPYLHNLRDMNRFLLFLPKRLPPFLFLLPSLLFMRRKHLVPAMASLLAVPIVSIDTIPAIFGAVGLLFLMNLRTKTMRRSWFAVVGIYALFSVCFLWIYLSFGNKEIQLYNPIPTVAKLFNPEKGSEALPVVFLIRAVVQFVFLYSLHGVLLWWLGRKHPEVKQVSIFLLLLVLSGAIGWAVLYLYIDGIQFFTSILTISQTAALILALALISPGVGRFAKAVVLLYILGTAPFNFSTFLISKNFKASLPVSKIYMDRISEFRPQSKVGISLESRHDFEKLWGHRNVMVHALGDMYLMFLPQYMKTIEIGVFDIPETPFRKRIQKLPVLNLPLDFETMDAFRSRMMKQSGIFYRFYMKLKSRNPALTVEAAQVAFIDYYQLDWGILSKTATVPPLLQARILRSEPDSLSGDTFVLLRVEPFRENLP